MFSSDAVITASGVRSSWETLSSSTRWSLSDSASSFSPLAGLAQVLALDVQCQLPGEGFEQVALGQGQAGFASYSHA